MKCKGENVDDDEIASIVRVWDNSEKDWEEFNKSYRNESDTTTSSDELESDKWDKRYGGETWRNEMDKKYLHKVIDYDKFPHKRYRSDSEDTDENTEIPAPKRFKESPSYCGNSEESSSSIDSEKSQIKRSRSYDSDESDYSPESKKNINRIACRW